MYALHSVVLCPLLLLLDLGPLFRCKVVGDVEGLANLLRRLAFEHSERRLERTPDSSMLFVNKGALGR